MVLNAKWIMSVPATAQDQGIRPHRAGAGAAGGARAPAPPVLELYRYGVWNRPPPEAGVPGRRSWGGGVAATR